MYLTYSWFIKRVIKSFRNNVLLTNRSYGEDFKKAIEERLNSNELKERPKAEVNRYLNKLTVMLEHLGKRTFIISFHKYLLSNDPFTLIKMR